MIITIDGPSGTGKTTVARTLASRLRFVYFDTGAMYRAITWLALDRNVAIEDAAAMRELLQAFSFNIEEKEGQKKYFVGDRDVTEVIRTQPVTAHVSAVSALKIVRDALLNIQHDFAKGKNVVFEGRDLGTVVFPDAECKIFLTADPEMRAERRFREFVEKSPESAQGLDKQAVLKDIERRDALDSSREVAPLKCPRDAHCIDTTHLSIDQVVDAIIQHVNCPIEHKKGGWFYRFILFLAKCFFKLFYRHKVYGVEHFCSGGAIIASNHVSYLDPPALAISSPEEVQFLAKEGLFKNPLFGSLIRALNSHPVSGGAGDIAVMRLISQLLTDGKKVILFPEGTRGDTDELQPLKQGIAMLVARSKTGVIPAYIDGTYQLWNRARKFPKLRGRTTVVFGSPIFWNQFSHLDKREAQEQFTLKLTASLNALREWFKNGAHGTPP
jgi:cytidylate kinase